MPRHALFHLEQVDGTGLQAQLRSLLVSAILSRRLQPGEPLPSSRAMAAQLGVSRNTVTLTYQSLVADGYLESRERSGYFVGHEAPVASPAITQPPEVALTALDWSERFRGRFAGLRLLQKPLNWREYPYPFVYGQADPSLFNHSDWRDCARQALGLRNFETLAGDRGGEDDPLLLDYIRARLLPRRGVLCTTGDLLVTLGAQNALYLVAELLCARGVRVAIEDPTYPDLRNILQRVGADLRVIPVDDEGMIVDERLQGVDVVFVTPSHQAPTTVTMGLDRRKALLAAAERYDFVIVEDDYDFELGFLKKPVPALRSLDPSGRVIYIGSFSKSLFPGLRLGYLVAPEPVIAEARGLRFLMLRHPPGHAQRTAAYYLALGHQDTLIARLRRALAERRACMQEALRTSRIDGIAHARVGGASFWIGLPEAVDTSVLARELFADGVLIEPGEAFFAEAALSGREPPRNYLRLGYSAIATERIPKGIARLARRLRTVNTH